MSDSPDKRGQSRFNKLQYPQIQREKAKKNTKLVSGASLGLDTGEFLGLGMNPNSQCRLTHKMPCSQVSAE